MIPSTSHTAAHQTGDDAKHTSGHASPHDPVAVHYLARTFKTWVGFVDPDRFLKATNDEQPLIYKQVTMSNVRGTDGQIAKKYGQEHLFGPKRYGWFHFQMPFPLKDFPRTVEAYASPYNLKNEFLREKLLPLVFK